MSRELRHRDIRSNGVRLHCVETGTGPPVLLLHGFPEFWYAWRNQIPALAGAGFRAVAPDLRGYNRSERPEGVASYRLELLVGDVLGLAEALGGQAVLVGHDWGGVLAWYAAMRRPDLVRGLVVLNAPHPAAFREELSRASSQWLRSWYAGLFQVPRLPEILLGAGRRALLRRLLRAGPAPDPGDRRAYLDAFADTAALAAAINYYRAAARFPHPAVERVRSPCLVIWGERDRFLVSRLAEGLERWVEDLRVERLPHATHWLHQREAPTVNRHLLDFLRDLPPR